MNCVALQSLESPFRRFTRDEWAQLRADTQLTLTIDDLRKLQSTHDPISLDEVVAIYLPLSRLLALYVAATQGLFKATQRFLGATDGKVPYIIGIAGSVAAGKSTTARVLQALLTRWPNTPQVQLVTTDGFLRPNAELIRQGIMDRKGFPESYDGTAVLRFLSAVKAGQHNVAAPVYSHITYDIVKGESIVVDRPDILIFEGINVLLPNRLPATAKRFRSSPIFLISPSSWTRTPRCWSNGISSASWASGRRRSAIRAAISANTPTSTMWKPRLRRARSGGASISSTCTRISCRPARAPTCSSPRAQATGSKKSR